MNSDYPHWLKRMMKTKYKEKDYRNCLGNFRIVGVNNRNLKDFSVDTDNSRRLRELIPRDMLFVSESGVSSAEDISKLREIGVDAVLIGEVLMRAPDKKTKLDELRGTI